MKILPLEKYSLYRKLASTHIPQHMTKLNPTSTTHTLPAHIHLLKLKTYLYIVMLQ